MKERMLKLTCEQANLVKGEYPHKHILQPIMMAGEWYLPASVMDNSVYESAISILQSCCVVEIEFPDEMPEL